MVDERGSTRRPGRGTSRMAAPNTAHRRSTIVQSAICFESDRSSPISGLCDLLQDQLDQVEVVFERQLASDMSAVNALCVHVEQYRGKMLRPALVLLSGLAVSKGAQRDAKQAMVNGPWGTPNHPIANCPLPIAHKHRVVAAVVEMIHMATLVHDDVLDESQVRRRGATVNHLWGNETAVILGDYLISNAFHLCSTLGDPAINLALGQVTNTLCEGELLQLHHRNDWSIDEATYLEIISRKTASLIGECCRLGASLAGADEPICTAAAKFGAALGTAFQIHDDVLDLLGEPDIVGKPLGQDLGKGKLTLPVIHYLAQASQSQRGEALTMIAERDLAGLRPRLIASGAVQRTNDLARSLIAQARSELAALPGGPANDFLSNLADSVVTRSY